MSCPSGVVAGPDNNCTEICKPSEFVSDGLCKVCPAGHIPMANRLECKPCDRELNQYAYAGECKTCPHGAIPRDDQMGCKYCSHDTEISKHGQCEYCQIGTVPNADATECIKSSELSKYYF